jgi:pilus assembly protein FimV
MVRKLVTFMTVGLLVVTPIAANALGFGAIKLQSALDERLDAEVELISPTPEDIETLKVNLASQAAFLRAGIERTSLHNALLFEVKKRNGGYYIHISSQGTVREPFLNFLLEMSWKNGRMLRNSKTTTTRSY